MADLDEALARAGSGDLYFIAAIVIAIASVWTLWCLTGRWLDRPAVQRLLWPQGA